jgi:uncharacterized membrane protein YgdD (TMEM256/DUF423 family)
VIGAVSGALAVGLGAFGAHGLEKIAGPEEIEWWNTAAGYQLAHAPVLVALGLLRARTRVDGAGWLLLAGCVVFCGTLYAMALGAPRWFGAITPLGGTALIVGWLMLAVSARGIASES